MVIGDVDDSRGPELAERVGGAFLRTDVISEKEVRRLFASTHAFYGAVDIAFDNAGISPPDDDSILVTELDAWRRVQEVDLTSAYLCCRAVLPFMVDQGVNTPLLRELFAADPQRAARRLVDGGISGACVTPL